MPESLTCNIGRCLIYKLNRVLLFVASSSSTSSNVRALVLLTVERKDINCCFRGVKQKKETRKNPQRLTTKPSSSVSKVKHPLPILKSKCPIHIKILNHLRYFQCQLCTYVQFFKLILGRCWLKEFISLLTVREVIISSKFI